MTDFEILNELEKELDIKFEVAIANLIVFEYAEEARAAYSVLNDKITGLKLNAIGLKEIPEKIIQLVHLEHLNLRSNHIHDIALLGKLERLKEINLVFNRITDLSALSQLHDLEKLDISYNYIQDLSPVAKLRKLKSLNLTRNNLTDISSLKGLKDLVTLDLDKNQISNLIGLKELTNLQTLYLHDNSISDISPLKNLKLLKRLSLYNNPIKKLPFWITNFQNEIEWVEDWSRDNATFFNNPIEAPPIEIIKQGKQAVKNWFKANKESLNEIKILLVGDAKAGKTSLIQRLKYDKYVINQGQTDGIVIETFKFEELPTFSECKMLHGTKGYFWDFGGQEIMSSTHQFFMTKRSVYLLVLEARKDAETDKQVRQWMERVQAFGGDSPVIIAANKIDLNPSFGIDSTILQRDYPQIKAYVSVSCQTGEGIKRLKEILEEYIPKAELFSTEIDERWINVKSKLQELTGKEFKLSHNQFTEICNQYDLVDAEEQSQAIKFLNDLGIVLHFDELDLAEYYVLDPLWVTAGVYRIITSEKAARQKGEIGMDELGYIINDEYLEYKQTKHKAELIVKYSPYECRFLADIMAQFKLSYYTDGGNKILIPDLLDKETPKDENTRFESVKEKLTLVYDYNYLPSNIMPNLIVELKTDVAKAWRTGVVLKCKSNINAEALVSVSNNRLSMTIIGDYKNKRAYLSIIRYFIDKINGNYNVIVSMLIPLPNYEKNYVKYDQLIKMERSGEKVYKNWDIEKEFEISVLLDGILSKEDVQKEAEKILSITNNNNYMGDTYNVSGQAAAVGTKASATNNTFNQQNNVLPESADYAELVANLTRLRQALLENAKTPENYIAISQVAHAEEGAKNKDGNKVLKALSSAGKWVLDISKEIGTTVLTEIIEKQMGLK